MNRLRTAWMFVVALWKSAHEIADEMHGHKSALRSVRRDLRQESGRVSSLREEIESLEAENEELRLDRRRLELEVERMENNNSLLQASLDFQLLWREKEVERMKHELAMHVRGQVDAQSGQANAGRLDILE